MSGDIHIPEKQVEVLRNDFRAEDDSEGQASPGQRIFSRFANHEYTPFVNLKPQDLLVALKLWVGRDQTWTYPLLAASLGMSVSEAHGAVKRAVTAGLLPPGGLGVRPGAEALREFLVHGAKYSFPALRGEMARGVPTAHAAPPLKGLLAEASEPPPVWPHPKGNARGPSLAPLISSAPGAALEDPALYELLALFDALRAGRARERALATRLLDERLR
jgi:hypothetical protein